MILTKGDIEHKVVFPLIIIILLVGGIKMLKTGDLYVVSSFNNTIKAESSHAHVVGALWIFLGMLFLYSYLKAIFVLPLKDMKKEITEDMENINSRKE